MTTAGPRYAGTIGSTSSTPYDDNNWVNVTNMGADDGSYATITHASYDNADWSYEARLTNFGFTIPAGATINGITVEIEGGYANGTNKPGHVQLTKNGTAGVGTDETGGTNWATTIPTVAIKTWGSSSSLWATSWSPAEINANTFGVLFGNQATANDADVSIDYVRVTVEYTVTGSTYEDAATLARTAGVSQAVVGDFGHATTLALTKALTQAGLLDMEGAATLARTAGVSAVGGLVFEDAAAFGVSKAISSTEDVTETEPPATLTYIEATMLGRNERWEIYLDDARGNRLLLLDGISYAYFLRVLNNPGYFEVSIPGTLAQSFVGLDRIVEIWRGRGSNRRLEFAGLLRRWQFVMDAEGKESVILSGHGPVGLLKRRIVAYAAGTAQADKSDFADDMLKEIVSQNFAGGATVSARSWASYNFTIAADLADAPSIVKAFSWRNVLDVLQEICETSRQQGTALYFDVVPTVQSDNSLGFEFRTYTTQRGSDRTQSGGNPTYFGPTWGNMQQIALDQDHTDDTNYAYAGGQGEASARTIEEAEDTTRSGASPWARAEGWKDARNLDTSAAVEDAAQELIETNRPRLRFGGDLLDTPQARYGINWEFGDRVTCQAWGQEFDGEIRSISFSLDGSGLETISARIEVDG